MKRNCIAIAVFLSMTFTVESQTVKSIHEIRSEFDYISYRYNHLLDHYDSLINLSNNLEKNIEGEIEIYQSCPTAYTDKLNFVEKKGDRGQRVLLSEYRKTELEKDNLVNQLVLNIKNFNNWNSIASRETERSYDIYIRPELERQQNRNNELLNYVRKINSLQREADLFMDKYDSCKMEKDKSENCEKLMEAYRNNTHLAEVYMGRYREVLADKEGLNTLKKEGFVIYREIFEAYYNEYMDRKSMLSEKNQKILNDIAEVDRKLEKLYPAVNSMILAALEQDIRGIMSKEIARLKEINKIISQEMGTMEFYYNLKQLKKAGELMMATLNPEINYELIIEELNEKSQFLPVNSDGRKAFRLAEDYSEVLEEMKIAINSYDENPYFCLNAYPQYSNDIVDENLEILNRKLDFENENLEIRTEKFMEISELDLSDTEFSLELLFKGHDKLEKLNLSNTQISSLKYLAETNIRWLDLSNTEIDRSDLEYLKYMDSIEYLNLSNTNLKKKDIYDLCYHLKVKRKNCIAR